MEINTYQVKTPIFEGPLDLLLNLIEKRKLFINEISLAEVTDDYLTYIKNLPKISISDMTIFILIAATLILIKSKSLISNIELTEEEEGQIEDLERRLKIYQKIKEVSFYLKNNFKKNIIFNRPEIKIVDPVFTPDKKIILENMLGLMKELVGQLPQKEFFLEITVEKVVNLEEVINNLQKRIESGLKLSFNEFSKKQAEGKSAKEQKIHIIVSFLAMLELVRQGLIEAIQGNQSSDIEIEKLT